MYTASGDMDSEKQKIIEMVNGILPKLHALIIGPGLGRDRHILEAAAAVAEEAETRSVPLVLDADSLGMVQEFPDVVKNSPSAVLTPNAHEFKLLCESVGVQGQKPDEAVHEAVERLAKALGGATIVLKGKSDVISDGTHTISCSVPGGLKRCGGIGDVLSGAIGTAMAWLKVQQFDADEVRGTSLECVIACRMTLTFQCPYPQLLSSFAVGRMKQIIVELLHPPEYAFAWCRCATTPRRVFVSVLHATDQIVVHSLH